MRPLTLLVIAALAVSAAAAAPSPKGAPRRAGGARATADGGAAAPAAPAPAARLVFAPLQTERIALAPGLSPAAAARLPAAAKLRRLCAPGCVVCGDGGACVVCAAGHAADRDGVCQPTGAPVGAGGAATCPAPHCDACEPELGCVACAAGHYLSGAAGCVPLPVADAGGADGDEAAVEAAVEAVAGDLNEVVAAAADKLAAEEADEGSAAEAAAEVEATAVQAAVADAVAACPGLVDNAGVCHGTPCADAGPRCAACEAAPGVAPGFRSCAVCAAGSYAFMPSAWGSGASFGSGVGVATCHACAKLGCAPGACADGVGCTGCPAGARLASTLTTAGAAGGCAGGGCPANCVPA